MVEAIEEKTDDKIVFFSEVDMDNRTGHITSEMPAWYFDVHIANLDEGIERKKRNLKNNLYEPDQILRVQEEVKVESARLKEITDSRPDLKGTARDKCANAYKSLEEQIKGSMPTRKQTKDGLVSPHEELKRLKSKHIKISPEVAKACGVKVVRGKISGDEAAKCYQILGKALGADTNVERLRRDGNTEAYQSMHDLTQAILKGVSIKGA